LLAALFIVRVGIFGNNAVIREVESLLLILCHGTYPISPFASFVAPTPAPTVYVEVSEIGQIMIFPHLSTHSDIHPSIETPQRAMRYLT
jgi:hypothetical protein